MTNFYYFSFSHVAVLLLFSIILTAVIILLSYAFSSSAPDVEKVSTYECGFDPYEDARHVFDVRFYLISMLFILFDLEAAFFFPWCASFSFLTIDSVWVMLDFAIELLAGYIYVWEIGALEWD